MLYDPYNSQPVSLTALSLRHTLKASCLLDMTEIKANTSVHDRDFCTHSKMDLGNTATLCLLDSLDSKQYMASPPQTIRYNSFNDISRSQSDISSEDELSPPKSTRRLVSQLNLTSLFKSPPKPSSISAPNSSSNKRRATKRPSRNLSNFFKLGTLIEDLMLEPKLCTNDICYTCSSRASEQAIQNALDSSLVDSEYACLNDSIFLQLEDIDESMVLSSSV